MAPFLQQVRASVACCQPVQLHCSLNANLDSFGLAEPHLAFGLLQAPAAVWSTSTLGRSSSIGTQCLAAGRTGRSLRHLSQVRSALREVGAYTAVCVRRWHVRRRPLTCLSWVPAAGKPLKTVLNLSTAIDTLSFNHDGQMMVMASRLKRDALRWVLRLLWNA